MSSEPKIFTLKQVLQSIRKTIEERYQSLYWVKVEMHKLNRYPSGHCFPELLQKEDGKIVAQISGTIWKQNFDRINQRFMEVVKEPLKDDLTLLMQIRIGFHEVYGLSLEIVDIDPSYSLGELQRERLETLKKLQELRLVDANQKLEFPLLPKRIAVVSAPASKGLNDFYQVLDNNKYGYLIERELFPAYVQGDLAINSIIEQLNVLKERVDEFDIVVIVRGGGGEVGLSCYNNFMLCKEIASFPLPVLTGIGHSTNLTVAEMIAYRNAITPTELGEFLIQIFREFDLDVRDLGERLEASTLYFIEQRLLELGRSSEQLHGKTKENLMIRRHQLDQAGQLMQYRTERFLNNQKRQQEINQQKIAEISLRFTQTERNGIDQLHAALLNTTEKTLTNQSRNIKEFEQTVRLLDPINVLNRGYSITTINGKIPKENDLIEGAEIETKTKDFILQSTLTHKEKRDEQ
ncbi:MAG: exodeoxyribonuclease VII large subunit [Bacteroidetes bacterium]|nr:MAG: exodeoxyribonuclease VII large subunit [Bacteroidota bacterium]